MSELVDSFYIENKNWQDRASVVLDFLKTMSVDALITEIEWSDKNKVEISPANISQFSSVDSIDFVVRIVEDAAVDIDYAYIGYMINKSANEAAQRKYGENHLKLAIQMGLVSDKPYCVTSLGRSYLHLSDDVKKTIRPKLYLRIPVIQKILIESKVVRVDGTKVLKEVLSESTAIRRRSNIKRLIDEIKEVSSIKLQKQIVDNIYWS